MEAFAAHAKQVEQWLGRPFLAEPTAPSRPISCPAPSSSMQSVIHENSLKQKGNSSKLDSSTFKCLPESNPTVKRDAVDTRKVIDVPQRSDSIPSKEKEEEKKGIQVAAPIYSPVELIPKTPSVRIVRRGSYMVKSRAFAGHTRIYNSTSTIKCPSKLNKAEKLPSIAEEQPSIELFDEMDNCEIDSSVQELYLYHNDYFALTDEQIDSICRRDSPSHEDPPVQEPQLEFKTQQQSPKEPSKMLADMLAILDQLDFDNLPHNQMDKVQEKIPLCVTQSTETNAPVSSQVLSAGNRQSDSKFKLDLLISMIEQPNSTRFSDQSVSKTDSEQSVDRCSTGDSEAELINENDDGQHYPEILNAKNESAIAAVEHNASEYSSSLVMDEQPSKKFFETPVSPSLRALPPLPYSSATDETLDSLLLEDLAVRASSRQLRDCDSSSRRPLSRSSTDYKMVRDERSFVIPQKSQSDIIAFKLKRNIH